MSFINLRSSTYAIGDKDRIIIIHQWFKINGTVLKITCNEGVKITSNCKRPEIKIATIKYRLVNKPLVKIEYFSEREFNDWDNWEKLRVAKAIVLARSSE